MNIELNKKEEKTYDIISKVVNGTLTRKEAMFELNKSRQQIYRLIIIYHSEGEQGFIHKGRGKQSEKKIKQNIIDELEQIYLSDFYDFSFQAFYEKLNEEEKYKGKYDISYSSLYNAFLNDDIISPIAHQGSVQCLIHYHLFFFYFSMFFYIFINHSLFEVHFYIEIHFYIY